MTDRQSAPARAADTPRWSFASALSRCLIALGLRSRSDGPDLAAATLEQVFEEAGCPFCRITGRTGERWLWMLLWEGVTDPGRRAEVRSDDGFCMAHWWLLDTVERSGGHSRSGGAIIAEDIISSNRTERFRTSENARVGRQRCEVCRAEQRSERTALNAAARHLVRAEFRERYLASDGACLWHTRLLLERIPDEAIGQSVIRHWRERAATLSAKEVDARGLAERAAHVSRSLGPMTRRRVLGRRR